MQGETRRTEAADHAPREDDQMMHLPKERGSSPFERYIQHIFQVLSVSAFLGAGALLWTMKEENIKMFAKLEVLEERLDDLRVLTADRYTGQMAQRDREAIDQKLESMRQRFLEELLDHETRIRTLETNG